MLLRMGGNAIVQWLKMRFSEPGTPRPVGNGDEGRPTPLKARVKARQATDRLQHERRERQRVRLQHRRARSPPQRQAKPSPQSDELLAPEMDALRRRESRSTAGLWVSRGYRVQGAGHRMSWLRRRVLAHRPLGSRQWTAQDVLQVITQSKGLQ